jgi:peptidoglycan/xylan/chitin deacetylase (PgdA/CDA1 family)
MTTNSLWFPPTDPNARTQGIVTNWNARRGRGAAESGETRVWTIEQERAAQNTSAPARRSVNRRRVLFAAGGIMLLAGAASPRPRRRARFGRSCGPAGVLGSRARSRWPEGRRPPLRIRPLPACVGVGVRLGFGVRVGLGEHGVGLHLRLREREFFGLSSSSATGNGQVATQPQWYVDDKGPMAIALTMDDGPDPTYTPQVLEIFAQYNIKATFNMIGEQVASNLSLVREVSAAGHTITNHTWDHADLSQCSYTEILSQIDRCNDALANANQTPTILRAPYGNWSKNVFEACAARNLKPVGWSVDPRDWDTADVDTQEIVANVMQNTRAHDIILEHDGGGVRRNTVAALKIFIPQLLAKGFNFVAM